MKTVGLAFTFLCICMLTTTVLQAATNFIPGYIIDCQNDTIQGLIDYQEWTKNPDVVGFKTSKKHVAVKYRPTELKGFAVLGKRYVGAVVQKETSPYRYNELENNPTFNLVADTVFLLTLIEGEKSLYYLKEWNDKEHFYIKEDSSYTLLLHKTYVEYSTDNVRKEFHNMRYIGQLTRYFWDDPSLLERIADTYYTRTDLESLFYQYLRLPNKKKAYVNMDSKVLTTFGLVAGVSKTMLQMKSAYYSADFAPSVNFAGGVSLDLAIMGKFHNFSLHNELLYSAYETAGDVDSNLFPNGTVFEFKYLKINSIVRYQPSWFFVHAGLSNGFSVKHYCSVFDDARRYEIGILVGAGITYKRFSLEIREEIGDGMSPNVDIYTKTNRHQLLLGYRF